MSRQFWLFLSLTNSEWNKIDYNRNVAWQEDILTESNDLSTKDCNGKTKKQITRSVRRLQSYFQITVTIFTLDYVNINFPSQYNTQNNPKSYPSLTLNTLFLSDILLILLRKIIITCITPVASEYFYTRKKAADGRFFLGPAGSCLGYAQLLSFSIWGMAALEAAPYLPPKSSLESSK